MAKTIREVIIEISLEQKKWKLTSPDFSEMLTSEKAIQHKRVKIAKQAAGKIAAADISAQRKVKESHEVTTAAILEGYKQRQGAAMSTADVTQQILDAQKKQNEESQALTTKRITQLQSMNDRYGKISGTVLKAGDAAFTTARGMAFLFTSTDDGFQKMVTNLAAVQGGFDIFRGGIEVLSLARSGVVALSTAQTVQTTVARAATVTNTGLAVANTAVATTATSATLATRALMIALGPVGITLLAVGAAYAALVSHQRSSTKATKEETEALKRKREELERLAGVRFDQGVGHANQMFDLRKMLQEAGGKFNVKSNDLNHQKKIKLLGDEYRELVKTMVTSKKFIKMKKLPSLFGFGGRDEQLADSEKIWKQVSPQMNLDKPLKMLDDFMNNKAYKFKQQEEIVRPGDVEKKINTKYTGKLHEVEKQLTLTTKQQLQLLKHREVIATAMVARHRDQLQFLKASKQEKIAMVRIEEQSLGNMKSTLKTLKDQLETLKQKNASWRASIGALTTAEQFRLHRIGQKKSRGEKLNKREVQYVLSKAGSHETVAKQYSKMMEGFMKKPGTFKLLTGHTQTGVGSLVAQQKESMAKQQEEIKTQNKKVLGMQKNLAEKGGELTKEIERVVDLTDKWGTALGVLQRKVDRMNDDQREAAN